jgi:hypothetical protein
MWWNKIKSNEYLDLFQKYEKLRIEVDTLALDISLVKQKYRARIKAATQPEETEKNKSEGVLLGMNGEAITSRI